jgi:hypothetical protein
MGQQQLLLLVLATVIVGLATVAGIQAFEQGSKRANQDALTQTAVKIASDAQANLQEPEALGGAGADVVPDDLESVEMPSLSSLGYKTDDTSNQDHTGDNGIYHTTDGECSINTDNTSTPVVTVKCASEDSKVTVEVNGLDSNNITTESQEIK